MPPIYLQCYDSKEPEAGVLHEVPAEHEDAASWREARVSEGWGQGGDEEARPSTCRLPWPSGTAHISWWENDGKARTPGESVGYAAGPSLQGTGCAPSWQASGQDDTCKSPLRAPQAWEGCSGRPEASVSCIRSVPI